MTVHLDMSQVMWYNERLLKLNISAQDHVFISPLLLKNILVPGVYFSLYIYIQYIVGGVSADVSEGDVV